MRVRAALALLLVFACKGSPTASHTTGLVDGRWTQQYVCLDIRSGGTSNLVAGCGHGQFPTPVLRDDGSFDADGTYRIEVGPVSPDPAPPAHYSGVLQNGTLTLKVVPSVPTIQPMTFQLKFNPNASCGPACV